MKITIRDYSSTARPHLKYMFEYTTREGKRKREFFPTKRAAQWRVDQIRADQKTLGHAASDLDEQVKREAVVCLERLKPYGRTLADAVNHYVGYLDSSEKSEKITILREEFLAAKQRDGASVRYLADLRSRMKPFVDSFGKNYAAEITPRMIEEWLAGLKMAAQSRNNTRRVLSTFFGYAARLGYCRENPIDKVGRAKATGADIGIFKPAEMRRMLAEADGDILAHLVLGGFAGLRDAEIGRLHWEEINWSAKKIDMSRLKTKTAARRLVHIEPNLEQWMEPFRFQRGPVRGPNWQKRFQGFKESLATKKNGKPIAWVANGLRHSFATYHLGHWKDAARTSLELGHSNATIVFQHYRELVSDESAAEWWSIEPDAGERVIPMDSPG